MSMYHRLRPLLYRFVFIRQGAFRIYCEGRLIALDQECVQVQSYHPDGSEKELWTIRLDTITEVSSGGRQLQELELKVKYRTS
jgi:hypothetical protein